MSVVLGTGEHRYRVIEDWVKLPEDWELKDVAAVAVDSKDRVYLFNRGDHPMIICDSDGNFLSSWGEGAFIKPHGLHIDRDDCLYCTDDGGHFVRKYRADGKLLLEIGTVGKPTPYMSGLPFHRCTHTALSPSGDIYVSDGYGNARIHKFSPDGKLIHSWGEPGTDPGQFNIAHNVVTDEDGWVYVADRENHRVQVFDSRGKFETQWVNLFRPCGLYYCRCGGAPRFIVGELSPMLPIHRHHPNIGPRLTILDGNGELLTHLGGENGPGLEAGKFVAPHGLAVDSRGDIYVGEVSYAQFSRLFPGQTMPWRMRSVQKLQKID
ncbi:MAG: peptidyl-alpha-hydroxyglycine alpha-amidating lyase family protein [Lautropia sp.]